MTAEMLSQVMDAKPALVCISALPPFALEHARALYSKLRLQSPELHIVICLWHFEGDAPKMAARFKLAPGDGFFTTLRQVLQDVAFRFQTVNPQSICEMARDGAHTDAKLLATVASTLAPEELKEYRHVADGPSQRSTTFTDCNCKTA